jgi:hypothetical protein
MAMEASAHAEREQRWLDREQRRALRPEVTEPALPPDAQPARTHTATRVALRRGALRGAWLLALAIAMVAAAILLARDDPRRYRSLLRHGTEATGIVRSVHQDGRFFNRFRVDYFVAGARRSATIWVPEGAKQRHRGEAVPVVYRTERPSEATVAGEWNVPWWRRMTEWFLGLWASIPLFAALAVLPALWRTRRALRHRPWVASPYDLSIAGRKGPAWLTLTGAAPLGLDIRLTVLAAPFRLGPFRSHPPACVWFVADESGLPIMVATPGPQRLYPVREGHRVFPWRRKRRHRITAA